MSPQVRTRFPILWTDCHRRRRSISRAFFLIGSWDEDERHMGFLMSKFWEVVLNIPEFKIIICGLNNSGKTTTLYKLCVHFFNLSNSSHDEPTVNKLFRKLSLRTSSPLWLKTHVSTLPGRPLCFQCGLATFSCFAWCPVQFLLNPVIVNDLLVSSLRQCADWFQVFGWGGGYETYARS